MSHKYNTIEPNPITPILVLDKQDNHNVLYLRVYALNVFNECMDNLNQN